MIFFHLILPLLLASAAPAVEWDSTWDNSVLQRARDARQKMLQTPPENIVSRKIICAPSGDPHDYTSFGPYWWPDPAKPDGLPYIRRDGLVNPAAARNDFHTLSRLRERLNQLALLSRYDQDGQAARHGGELIRVFFLNPETRMNPHMTYAQGIPGRVPGRELGCIDGYILVEIVHAAEILQRGNALSTSDYLALRQWFGAYGTWLDSAPMRKALGQSSANIGLAYQVQKICFFRFAGNQEMARQAVQDFQAALIGAVAPDGRLPHEMTRTKSFDYTCYALHIILDGAAECRKLGIDLFSNGQPAGNAIRRAVAFAASFRNKEDQWPGKQLGKIKFQQLAPILYAYSRLVSANSFPAPAVPVKLPVKIILAFSDFPHP